jgi:hypothetical protein
MVMNAPNNPEPCMYGLAEMWLQPGAVSVWRTLSASLLTL